VKKACLAALVLILFPVIVFSTNFSPTLLKLSAPAVIRYNFDGTNLSIPVTVTDTQANTVFPVFTRDKAASVIKMKNGFLGWHYVNKIDTLSLYGATQADGQGEQHNHLGRQG